MKIFTLLVTVFSINSFSYAQTSSLNAGPDQTIRQNQIVQLNGRARNVNSFAWKTNGTGTFSNIHKLKTKYTPSTADITHGKVILTLYSTSGARLKDNMMLKILPCPSVTLNPHSDTICGNDFGGTYDLHPIISGSHYYVQWSTPDGQGYFDDETNPNTSYEYTSGDAGSGRVWLKITVYDSLNFCAPVSDSFFLKLNDPARIDLQDDGYSSCGPDPIFIDGNLSGTAFTVYWSTSGTGYFSPASGSATSYYPSVEDRQSGYVEIYGVTNDPPGPCGARGDFTWINFYDPIAYAGPDIETCAASTGGSIALDAFATNFDEVTWSTNGNGYFDDVHSTYTSYNYATGDIDRTDLKLYLTAANYCASSTDTITLILHGVPGIAFPGGQNFTICASAFGGSFWANAVIINSDDFVWTTSGSGYFDDDHSASTYYNFDGSDVGNANIQLTLTATNNCGDNTNTIFLYLQEAPYLYFPDPYVSACSSDPVIYANVYPYGYISAGTWTTNGSGTFDDPSSIYSAYTASQEDIDNGCVDLIYTSNEPAGSCGIASGSMMGCFYDCGKSSVITNPLSMEETILYPNPADGFIMLMSNAVIDRKNILISDASGKNIPCKWSDANSYTLNIAELPDGIYFLHIIADQTNQVLKFVKR